MARHRCGHPGTRPDDRVRRMHRRHRGRRRRHRGDPGQGRLESRPGRGRSAHVVARLSHEGSRRLSAALSGIGLAQDARQGDQYPPGTLRRRIDHRQLDFQLPNAGKDACPLARSTRSGGFQYRSLAAVVRTNGKSAVGRAMGHSAESKQRAAGNRHRAARHCVGSHPPQCERLLEHRLLRDGLPHECQAIDAGHDDSSGIRRRRNTVGQCTSGALHPSGCGAKRVDATGGHREARFDRVRIASDAQDRCPALCRRGWRDRLACSAVALAGARPAFDAGPADVPASDDHLRRADVRSRSRTCGRAANGLFRSLSGFVAYRWPDGIQARGAATAPGDFRHDDVGLWRAARGTDA